MLRSLAGKAVARSLARPQNICQHCLRPVIASSASPQILSLPGPSRLPARFASNSSTPDRGSEDHASSTNGNGHGSKNNGKRKGKQPAHKPAKQRLQAASAPLRNAPSSTRGPLFQCIAHTTAEKYDLVNLSLVLHELGVRWDEVPEGDRERAFVIGPWKGRGGAQRVVQGKDIRRVSSAIEEDEGEFDDDFGYGERGEIWVFNSGNFVTWGLTEEEGRGFLRDVIRRRGAKVEIDRLLSKEHEIEEMDFVVDPNAKTSILGNLILLGHPPELSTFPHSPALASLLARYTLALSLSRSSSLSVLEGRLDDHIASVSFIPRVLERTGAQPMQRKEVIRKLGELMTLRMAVNTRGGGLEDTPDIYWAEPQLEAYFDSIATEFEIKERIEAFNKKTDYAQEIQNTLRALLTEASGHRMEMIIILLIAVEVVIVLIREGPELGHKLISPMIASARKALGLPTVSPTTLHDTDSDGTHPLHQVERSSTAPLLGMAALGTYNVDQDTASLSEKSSVRLV